MDDWQWALAIALSGILTAQCAYLTATLIAAALFRLPVNKVSLGVGPALIQFKLGDVTYRIAGLLLTAYVQFVTANADLNEAPIPGTFETAPWWQRLACAVVGSIAMIAIAAPFIGVDAGIVAASSALTFVASLVANPFQVVDFTAVTISLKNTLGPTGAAAYVSAFVGGLQFLPIPFMAGGAAIIHLAEAFHGGPLPIKLLEQIYRLSFFSYLLLLALAVIAIVR